MRRSNSSVAALAVGLLVMTLAGQCLGQLQQGFYYGKCGSVDVESVVFDLVKTAFDKDSTLVAAMLRMQFHDCFVRGCDASILLEGTNTEKKASSNASVRGYELIDAIKGVLERLCPGLVSCADIIIIATRVTVFLAKGSWYNVQTGRRDGYFSSSYEAESSLPSPNIPVANAVSLFGTKGIDTRDLVLLLGGHTVGIAHCDKFENRLYNYQGTGTSDPSINPLFLPELQGRCPRYGPTSNFAFLDQISPLTVDNGYYRSIVERKGVLQVDQELAFHPLTKDIVAYYAYNNDAFNTHFGYALINLGKVDVLTGTQGQIRQNCRYVKPF